MSRVLPILFNSEMVQAILEDRKTVTRRIAKGIYPYSEFGLFATKIKGKEIGPISKKKIVELKAPYKPGDILYVRETWNICSMWSDGNRVTFIYKADENEEDSARTITVSDEMFDKFGEMMHGSSPEWRPSLHMPKEAARIFLRVKDVNVGRLQEITEYGAVKEGFTNTAEYCVGKFARDHFRDLWNATINKKDIEKYGWNANPWVWIIRFERCEKPECKNE